jgi:hypothetical protein
MEKKKADMCQEFGLINSVLKNIKKQTKIIIEREQNRLRIK